MRSDGARTISRKQSAGDALQYKEAGNRNGYSWRKPRRKEQKKRPAQNRTGLIKKSIEKTCRTVITTDGICTISLLHNLLSADNIYARRQRTQTRGGIVCAYLHTGEIVNGLSVESLGLNSRDGCRSGSGNDELGGC